MTAANAFSASSAPMSGKMLKSGVTRAAAMPASAALTANVTSATFCTSTPTTAHASRFCDIARIALPSFVRVTNQCSAPKTTRAPATTSSRCHVVRRPPTVITVDDRVSPWRSCSSRSSTGSPGLLQERGRRRDLLDDLELSAAHLDEDHVDPRLVILVELDGTDGRVLDVDLREGIADGFPVGPTRRPDRLLDGGHHRVLERQRGEAAVDAHGRLPALEPPLLPLGIEGGRPVRGLHDAVADGRIVLHLPEELGGGKAAARGDLLV